MEWQEVIKVRGTGTGYEGADIELLKQLKSGMKFPGLKGVRIYAHASVTDDLMITLTWKKGHLRTWGSDLAHRLTDEFKRYGLVDHSVWVELALEESAEKQDIRKEV